MNKIWGSARHEEAGDDELDVSEHGMWGYPEFYIPVPGGYDQWSNPPWARETPPPAPTPAVEGA